MQKSVKSSAPLLTNGRRLALHARALATDKCAFSASASLSSEWAPIFLPQVRHNSVGATQKVGRTKVDIMADGMSLPCLQVARNLLGRWEFQNAKTAEMGCSGPILLSNVMTESSIGAANRRTYKNSSRVSLCNDNSPRRCCVD